MSLNIVLDNRGASYSPSHRQGGLDVTSMVGNMNNTITRGNEGYVEYEEEK